MSNEFIEAYSDDQIYLSMIKTLVENNPIESAVPDKIKYSAFCRLWVVMMVGSIEAMIKAWDTGDIYWEDISAYFDKQSNENKVSRLRDAFSLRGLTVDTEMFKDFLAIKYIRNAYVHSNWNEDQRNYAISRGYPSDVMNFEPKHFSRMQEVYSHVMNGLGKINAWNSILKKP